MAIPVLFAFVELAFYSHFKRRMPQHSLTVRLGILTLSEVRRAVRILYSADAVELIIVTMACNYHFGSCHAAYASDIFPTSELSFDKMCAIDRAFAKAGVLVTQHHTSES